MKLRYFLPIILISAISCSSDKQAELNKLRKQQSDITRKIQSLESDTSAAAPETNKAKLVAVKEIMPATFNHYIEVQGRLDGDLNVGISPQAPGKLESILVSVGQNVAKGQMLAKVDDDVMQQQLKQLETNLEFLTEVYEKQKRLWEQNVGSEVQYLGAKNNKESLEQQIVTVKDQIGMMHIVSPITGTMEEILVKEGQFVSPGFPIMRVVNFEKLKVVADLSESHSMKMKEGDKVLIYFPDIQQEVDAVVSFVSRYINPSNRSFTVEARINKHIPGLKVNMVAVLKINDYSAPNSISIPVNLIQNDRNDQVVYIAQAESDPIAKKVSVVTGVTYEGMVEIREGLNSGDKLITVGYQDIEDGEAIRY